MNRAILLLGFLFSALPAQIQTTAPNPPSFQNVDRPFPGGIGRYQQWYSLASLQGGFTTPVRIEQMEYFAGTSQTSNATTIDMEVLMSHGYAFGITGTYDTNYASTPVVVVPRHNAQLLAGAPGAVVMTLPFSTRFTWDRQRPLLVEIRIYGNSRSNQPFTYNLRGTTASIGTTTRVYQAGSAGATQGMVQQGVGLVTRFTARPGAVLDYGAGCPGENNIVPVNTVQQLPWPGITWSHQLSQAASQRLCMWVFGASNTTFGPFSLPADVGTLLGQPAYNCMLRADPAVTLFTTTVGGGPGAGIANVSVQLPAVTFYVGMSFYTQWFVADPMAPNGVLSGTAGVWSIVAPPGG